MPITYGYISDAHEKKTILGVGADGLHESEHEQQRGRGAGRPVLRGEPAVYNAAFTTFFQRLADDGIDKSNTLFVITADEGDHFAGANATRAVQPTCGAAPVGWQSNSTCDYSGGNKIGEMQVSIHGLLQNQLNNTTPFYDEPQGNSIFITGNPGPNDPSTRQLERDFSNATVNDVYDGNVQENLTQYEADPTVEQLLHFVNADANRTPSFTMFPKARLLPHRRDQRRVPELTPASRG